MVDKQDQEPKGYPKVREPKIMVTGRELKAARKETGINQTQMGRLIGYSRHAISYWETRTAPITYGQAAFGVPKVYLEALGIEVLRYSCTSTRTRGDGVLQGWDQQQLALDQSFAKEWARIEAKNLARAAQQRVRCGARTRKGQPCRNMSEAGRRRCKFHGGRSTGPKTAAGKERIAKAQRLRWKRHRAKQI